MTRKPCKKHEKLMKTDEMVTKTLQVTEKTEKKLIKNEVARPWAELSLGPSCWSKIISFSVFSVPCKVSELG